MWKKKRTLHFSTTARWVCELFELIVPVVQQPWTWFWPAANDQPRRLYVTVERGLVWRGEREVVQSWSREDKEKDWWSVGFWQVTEEKLAVLFWKQFSLPLASPSASSSAFTSYIFLDLTHISWQLERLTVCVRVHACRTCVFAKHSLMTALHHASRDAEDDKHWWAW